MRKEEGEREREVAKADAATGHSEEDLPVMKRGMDGKSQPCYSRARQTGWPYTEPLLHHTHTHTHS